MFIGRDLAHTRSYGEEIASIIDEEVKRLIDELSTSSSDFARFWKRHDVLDRQGGTRGFVHPRHGLIHYRQTTLFTSDNDDVKLVLLKPVARAPGDAGVA